MIGLTIGFIRIHSLITELGRRQIFQAEFLRCYYEFLEFDT